jgi:hypothetical protein
MITTLLLLVFSYLIVFELQTFRGYQVYSFRRTLVEESKLLYDQGEKVTFDKDESFWLVGEVLYCVVNILGLIFLPYTTLFAVLISLAVLKRIIHNILTVKLSYYYCLFDSSLSILVLCLIAAKELEFVK